MADLMGFDATTVEPNGVFEPLPAGKYQAIITDSSMEQTKSGNGEFLKLTLQIQGGQFDGRTLFDRLNLNNPNQQAVDIARGTLSAICRAVGVLQPKDSAELHNRTFTVKVKCKKREDNGEMSNEIGGYLPFERSTPQGAPTNGAKADPWKRA